MDADMSWVDVSNHAPRARTPTPRAATTSSLKPPAWSRSQSWTRGGSSATTPAATATSPPCGTRRPTSVLPLTNVHSCFKGYLTPKPFYEHRIFISWQSGAYVDLMCQAFKTNSR